MKRNVDSRILQMLATLTLVLGSSAPVHALDITFGDVQVQNLGSYGFTANDSVLSFDSGATDQLYQMFGYIGTAGGVGRVNATNYTEITPISNSGPIASSVLELNATGAAALGLNPGDIQIAYSFELVNDTSADDLDGFNWDFSITNQSGLDIDLSFYSYLDLDLDGSGDFGDDIANANLDRLIVTDANSSTLYFWHASNSGSADHFEVQEYPQVRNFLDGMGTATDLSDSNANFGPADFTAAFQYDFSILSGESAGSGVGSITPLPEPSTALLVMLGLAGLARRPRRA